MFVSLPNLNLKVANITLGANLFCNNVKMMLREPYKTKFLKSIVFDLTVYDYIYYSIEMAKLKYMLSWVSSP